MFHLDRMICPRLNAGCYGSASLPTSELIMTIHARCPRRRELAMLLSRRGNSSPAAILAEPTKVAM